MDEKHFNQPKKRDADFIMPPNIIKAKIGDGGLSNSILERAQAVLESHQTDFKPLARAYLTQMKEGIKIIRDQNQQTEKEEEIALILYPCVQLKANGSMFKYPLVTKIAERFVQFMEVVEKLDEETLEIAEAFYKTIKIIISGGIKSETSPQREALIEELNKACNRYFQKHEEALKKKKKP